jgi:3-phosphoshikimate 1-carboxyvinyltransferase
LADRPTEINGVSSGQDVLATKACLQALGAEIHDLPKNRLGVKPISQAELDNLRNREVNLHCKESGTTLRLLLPVVSALGIPSFWTGEGNLPARPIADLVQTLTQLGVHIQPESLPFHLTGQLQPGSFVLPGHISSQYFSGLLFALPLLQSESYLHASTPIESLGYVQMTLQVLNSFGVEVEETEQGYYIPAAQQYISPGSFLVESDWSNAAFWLVAAGFSPQGMQFRGLDPLSLQGDRAIASILEQWGAEVTWQGQTLTVRKGVKKPLQLSCEQIPDLVPILAVLAAFTPGLNRLSGLQRLQYKESNRIQGVLALVQSIGGKADYNSQEDCLLIVGQESLPGGLVDSLGDHRLVMAAAVAGSLCQAGVQIKGAESVAKSYPDFFKDWQSVGGVSYVIANGK